MEIFEELLVGDSAMRIRIPQNSNLPPLVIGLHGLTGDEEAMSIFAARIPPDYMVILPRGLFPSDLGGYTWVPTQNNGYPPHTEFSEAAQSLQRAINLALHHLGITPSQYHFMGFSQGAALAYVMQSAHLWEVRSIAAISGFMPDGLETSFQPGSLVSLDVFIAHGTRDEMIPVRYAREAVATLKTAGAMVTYCEAAVGHKLSAECFSALHQFYRGML